MENINTKYKPFTSNISREEQNVLKDLMNNSDIILKPTDKGSGLVLMHKSYIIEIFWLLSDICILMFIKKYHWILINKSFKSYNYW